MTRRMGGTQGVTRAKFHSCHDPIAVGVSPDCLHHRQKRIGPVFLRQITPRFHTTSTLRDYHPEAIPKNRLSRHGSNALGFLRIAGHAGTQESSASYDHSESRPTADKKRAFDRLLSAVVRECHNIGIVGDFVSVAVDSTGMESHHVSRHYLHRCKRSKHYRRWPKLVFAVDVNSHVIGGVASGKGPSNDSPYFPEVMLPTARRMNIHQMLADCGFDSEANHILCRHRLHIPITAIPVNRRRTRKWPKTKYRRLMKRDFPKDAYRQRNQIESVNSRFKRRLGSALSAHSEIGREVECLFRVLTHNLMILRCV